MKKEQRDYNNKNLFLDKQSLLDNQLPCLLIFSTPAKIKKRKGKPTIQLNSNTFLAEYFLLFSTGSVTWEAKEHP